MEFFSSGNMALLGGAILFVVAGAVAYIVFRILRKSVRMAFRMALVAALLIIAAIGSVSLWWFASSDQPTRPAAGRRR